MLIELTLRPIERKPCSCLAEKYLKDLKASGGNSSNSKMIYPQVPCSHDITHYVTDNDLREVAELQWQAVVEHMYLKQGKLKNYLAVYDRAILTDQANDVALALALALALTVLVFDLGGAPWKRKAFTFGRNPRLFTIQDHDLRSKSTFVRRMDEMVDVT